MLFRSMAQLKPSLLCVAGFLSAVWFSNCQPGAYLQPQVCTFAPPLVLAQVLFYVACSAQLGFCLVWFQVKVAILLRS